MLSACRTPVFAHVLRRLAALLAAAAWSIDAAQGAPADAGAAVPALRQLQGITEYRLPNGLQVLLAPDDSKPTTTVNLTVRVGSRHENYGETGMAHLLEHLVFKGTPTHRNVWAEFAKRGLRANGTTWVDRTNYFASFTASGDTLDWTLGWLADAMVNSLIAEQDLASEMTVVRNEMEMGENEPGRILLQRTMRAMFDWHNYGKDTIGARSDVENVDISKLQAFYRLHYQPDNATLIVSGRFDPTATLQRIAGAFGPIPKPKRVLPTLYTLDAAQDGERHVTVRRVGATPLIFMAHHIPPGAHPDYAAASLLMQVLGDKPGGRLHKHLVERQLAADAFGFAMSFADPGAGIIGVQLAPGQDVDAARQAMAAVLDGLAAEPVTAAELERVRTKWLNDWEQGFADPEILGVALSQAIALGDWRLHFLQRDRVRQATLEQVQRVARERLKPDNRTVAMYRPVAAPDRAPAPTRVDVAAALQGYTGDGQRAQAEVFDATPAALERRTQRSRLASGMQLALLPKGTRGRTVQWRLALHYGDEASMRDQRAVVTLVAALLDKGAQGLSRQQIADQMDARRTQFNAWADKQRLVVNVETVSEHLPATIELVGRLLREPSFPPEQLEEVRRQWLAALAEQRQAPEAMAWRAVARQGNPYPRGHLLYIPSFDEEEADVRAVTRAQLQEFHRRLYAAAPGEFSAVGEMDVDSVRRAAAAAFGDWPPAAGRAPYRRIADPHRSPVPARLMLPAPDKQNAALLGQLPLPMSDTHPDHVSLTLANHIFGGSGASRLWKRIRETDGLSYDVRSWIDWSMHDAHSRLMMSAIYAPQNQPRVEAAWRAEAERSLRGGFTQAEVDEARNSLLNLRRLSRAQDGNVAWTSMQGLHIGRTLLYEQQIDDALAAATLEQVNAAWRRWFAPDKLVMAWAGDFDKAKAP